MHRPPHLAPALLTLAALIALTACSAFKLPQAPVPIQTPTSAVTSVVRTGSSREASRYLITVRFDNPNDFPLPITHADYRLTIGSARYEGDFIPPATLPALGSVSIELPAILAAGDSATPAGSAYETSGTIRLLPPGEIRSLMNDLGIPPPTAPFSGTGPVADSPSSPSTAEPVAP